MSEAPPTFAHSRRLPAALRSPIGWKRHGRPSCGDISMTIAGEAIRGIVVLAAVVAVWSLLGAMLG